MFQTDKVRIILLEELVKAQGKNPKFSMRAYAKKVGVSQAAISEVLSGKRPLTKKAAEKILSNLDRSPDEIYDLTDTQVVTDNGAYRSIDMDTFHMISEWHYYAILSLAETIDFQGEPEWIARRLGISVKVATDSVERLI